MTRGTASRGPSNRLVSWCRPGSRLTVSSGPAPRLDRAGDLTSRRPGARPPPVRAARTMLRALTQRNVAQVSWRSRRMTSSARASTGRSSSRLQATASSTRVAAWARGREGGRWGAGGGGRRPAGEGERPAGQLPPQGGGERGEHFVGRGAGEADREAAVLAARGPAGVIDRGIDRGKDLAASLEQYLAC